ncbi:MAG: radical SAM protein [Kiritimatiellae bacterium]|nr:radical SAM protein [Kiritimatiellia bacterium]
MNIKLISPRSAKRPMDSDWKTRMSPPLSLLVLGALTPREHTVLLADENIERVRLDDTPDLVGLTVKVDTAYRAAEIARAYRRRGIPVVMGGIHPTVCPESCAPLANTVVIGEAEDLWPQLLDDHQRGALRPLYRNERPVDIARTPPPRWELLREKSYLFTNTLCIGRGCPWRCDFCYNSSPHVDARYRIKPLAHILEEIRLLGVPHVMFIDDNFIGDPDRARELMLALRPMRLTWHAAVSADIGRREDLLDLMAESGCKSLFIGFESINPDNLRRCRKSPNQVERYDDSIARIHARGIMVNASLVFGFDGDDASVFPATLDWLVRQRVATMTAHIMTPYPGTQLHDQLRREGRILDHDLRHYDTAHTVFQPRGMSPDALESGYRWIYDQFYSWANIFRRMPTDARQRTAYLEFNLLYRKYGKITCHLGRFFGMRRLAKLAKELAYPAEWTEGSGLFPVPTAAPLPVPMDGAVP